MNSLRRLLVLATLFSCLAIPAQLHAQINLTLKDGSVQVNGVLGPKGKKDAKGNGFKLYTVDLVGGLNYQIDMTSDKLDSYLRLEDSAGKELVKDDDGGEGLNARIKFKAPKDGKYRIVATTFKANTGPFTLSIKQAGGVKGPDIVLADGKATIKGKLEKDDPKDTFLKESVSKIYKIKLTSGKTYQIDMTSTAVDSYLRLMDSTGKELAKDDDGGGFPNARIVFDCQADGVYRIVATSFNQTTGDFTLTVMQK